MLARRCAGTRDFFIHLRAALTGPSKREWPQFDALRYTFILLREVGVTLTQAQLEELMVDNDFTKNLVTMLGELRAIPIFLTVGAARLITPKA